MRLQDYVNCIISEKAYFYGLKFLLFGESNQSIFYQESR